MSFPSLLTSPRTAKSILSPTLIHNTITTLPPPLTTSHHSQSLPNFPSPPHSTSPSPPPPQTALTPPPQQQVNNLHAPLAQRPPSFSLPLHPLHPNPNHIPIPHSKNPSMSQHPWTELPQRMNEAGTSGWMATGGRGESMGEGRGGRDKCYGTGGVRVFI